MISDPKKGPIINIRAYVLHFDLTKIPNLDEKLSDNFIYMRHRRTKLLLKFSKNKNGNHLPFLIFVKIKMDIAFHFNFWLFFVKNLKNFSKNKNGNRLPYLIFGQNFSKIFKNKKITFYNKKLIYQGGAEAL